MADFPVTIPGRNCAEYFWENLLIFAQISRNIHKSCFLRKCLGIVDFRVTIPGNKLISRYCYSETNLFPGNNTWKSIYYNYYNYRDLEITTKKNLILWISPRKRKYFKNILACESRDQVLLIHKKPEVKNLMLQSL